ncbi:MAG: YebC/PmpR family DNA-binding transcriptional regulator [Candidatus Moraniibacteriota bacterium]|jgi:YebC/PmpR family DNA-binding regulatory protein
MLHELMSGHSHWAGIKQRKGINDAKRGKIFTKYGKLVTIAARDGGGKLESNFQLRMAVDRAREMNMPKENIERAIKRGTGEIKGAMIEEILYEAVGPGELMLLISCTTDNKNRTVSEVKTIFTKNNSKLGEKGSAMWNFEQVGSISIELEGKDADELEMLAIEAGAKDTILEEDVLNIITDQKDFAKVRESLAKENLKILDSGLIYLPKTTIAVDEKTREACENLMELLDDHDDVSEIYTNLA